jgi:hypothetical protein
MRSGKERFPGSPWLGRKEKLKWSQSAKALTIEAPQRKPSNIAIVFKSCKKMTIACSGSLAAWRRDVGLLAPVNAPHYL